MNAVSFHDHFSAVAAQYAQARPEYPQELFDWIASIVPSRELCWEAGCGSGQASRDLACVFERVHATDPSAAQITNAKGPANVDFAVEPGEACSLADASVDAVCVAQALHWFDLPRFFAECERVLKPGGVLFAWGYQDIEVDDDIAGANAALQARIRDDWAPQRDFIDAAYAGFEFPFGKIEAPRFELRAEWTLPRLLGYFSSYSATKTHRERTGEDAVALHADELAAAWGDTERVRGVRWPMFVHARRKPY
ncbi:class I SAM-dependent methyltransferase [Pseudoluteimonas lycopersici]|uniref:Class I SAM-dependent methyltransferase n=1 Tax=Pseudoluteimonas lycopersici TaxID=1324796 RepID=A0A516V7J0_9GAMM|nr:class I SAM-dependent methyltransferase [Lysobacter lycopersici]QDQ74480.1 class I SAM-dependent methyltransferase [Lysobacter lycopersici]